MTHGGTQRWSTERTAGLSVVCRWCTIGVRQVGLSVVYGGIQQVYGRSIRRYSGHESHDDQGHGRAVVEGWTRSPDLVHPVTLVRVPPGGVAMTNVIPDGLLLQAASPVYLHEQSS